MSRLSYLATLIIILSFPYGTVSTKEIYQCTDDNGGTVFSDTPCATNVEEMDTIQVYVPPPPSKLEQEAAADSAEERRLEKEYERYRALREDLVQEREKIAQRQSRLGLRQTFSDMIEARTKLNALDDEIEALDNAWEDTIDPEGAPARQERREISQKLERIEKRQKQERRRELFDLE